MIKKEFTAPNGNKGMTIDCGSYEVEIFKSVVPAYYGQSIKFTEKKSGNSKFICSVFKINWDDEKDGGRLELSLLDRWGSEMNFVHYPPSDLKFMFEFIGKGHGIFDDGFARD